MGGCAVNPQYQRTHEGDFGITFVHVESSDRG
jgi:hypothetical protein